MGNKSGHSGVARRWPVGFAVVSSIFTPVLTIRRTDHAPLWAAWLVHVAGVAGVTAVIVVLVAWGDSPYTANFVQVLAKLGDDIRWYINSLDQQGVWIGIIAIALLVQAAAAVVAGFITPWGAIVEPPWPSFRRALRRVWLMTPCLVISVGIVGTSAVYTERTTSAYYNSWQQVTPYPQYPNNAAQNSPQMQAYNQAYKQWDIDYQAHMRDRPWLVKYSPYAFFVINLATVVWLLITLLRAGSAGQRVLCCRWPAQCEQCGYNLAGTASHHSCPECGLAMQESIGPKVRPGCLWQERRQLGRIYAFFATAFYAVIQPTRFGKTLRLYGPGKDHHRYLYINLPLIFLTGPIGMALVVIVMSIFGNWFFREDVEEMVGMILGAGTMLGVFAVVVTMVLMFFGAGLVGSSIRRISKRDVLPTAMQAACYLCPYLLVWTIFVWLFSIMMLIAEETSTLTRIAELLHIPSYDEGLVVFALYCILGLILLVHLGTLLGRITSATRFANR